MYGNVSAQSLSQQFQARHGNDGVRVNPGWIVFSDGAMCETDALGALREPPTDPYECAKIQVCYHEELLGRAVHSFKELKGQLTGLARINAREGHPPPSETDMEKLRGLHKTVKKCQAAVKAAQEKREKAKPPEIQQRNAASDACRRLNEEILSELDKITI